MSGESPKPGQLGRHKAEFEERQRQKKAPPSHEKALAWAEWHLDVIDKVLEECEIGQPPTTTQL